MDDRKIPSFRNKEDFLESFNSFNVNDDPYGYFFLLLNLYREDQAYVTQEKIDYYWILESLSLIRNFKDEDNEEILNDFKKIILLYLNEFKSDKIIEELIKYIEYHY